MCDLASLATADYQRQTSGPRQVNISQEFRIATKELEVKTHINLGWASHFFYVMHVEAK